MISLYEAKPKEKYFLREITPCVDKIRLEEMGFINCEIVLIKVNFGKKNFLVYLRGFKIILRDVHAKNIWVEKC